MEERAYLAPRSNHQPLGWEWGWMGESGLDGRKSSANEAENDPDHYRNTAAARDCLKHFTSVTYCIPGKVGRCGRMVSSYAARWSEVQGRQKKKGKQHQYGLGCRNDDCLGMLSEDHDEWTFPWLYSRVASDGFVLSRTMTL